MPPNQGQGQGVSIDLRDYKERAAAGNITLQRLGPKTFQMIMAQYDPYRGEPLEPVVVALDIDSIDASIKQQEKVIADANAMLDNLNDLKAEMDAMDASGTTLATPTGSAGTT